MVCDSAVLDGGRTEPAWYAKSRLEFIAESSGEIANRLAGRAAQEGLDPGPDQHEEWQQSVQLLQRPLGPSLIPDLLTCGLGVLHHSAPSTT